MQGMDPAAGAALLESPMMQSLLSNPELMRTIMETNPQMRALMDSNPELARMMRDPQVLRQAMDMMRSPGLRQEMMRNNDLAMANLELHPEGFSALQRMLTEVQDPLMAAATAQVLLPPLHLEARRLPLTYCGAYHAALRERNGCPQSVCHACGQCQRSRQCRQPLERPARIGRHPSTRGCGRRGWWPAWHGRSAWHGWGDG